MEMMYLVTGSLSVRLTISVNQLQLLLSIRDNDSRSYSHTLSAEKAWECLQAQK